MQDNLSRRLAAEFIGTAMLLAAVVGSGIMAERLSGGNVALALLANTVAIGAALVALIFTFAPISGAHLNPAVTMWSVLNRHTALKVAALYIAVQISGAILGVGIANVMFGLPFIFVSTRERTGAPLWLGEFVATFGLIGVIHACSRLQKTFVVPIAVAAYISAAIWFTSSSSFANPAVTLARALSDTFTGIRPVDVPGFIVAQLLGALAAVLLFRWLVPLEAK
jgi:glycerol uptake facilitator-like aquaporin